MADGKGAAEQIEHWAGLVGKVAAPVTVVGAVLFYFGYVSSAAEYAYFGINVDVIGLSTRDYIMRSPQTLLDPLIALALLAATFLMLNLEVRKRVTRAARQAAGAENEAAENDADNAAADNAAGGGGQAQRVSQLIGRVRLAGLAVLTVGLVMLFGYASLRDWTPYPLADPLLIGGGAAVVAYASHVLGLLRRLRGAATEETPEALTARRIAGVFLAVMIAASVWWANATIAQWSGRGLAQHAALHLGTLPSVILDTQEQLYLKDGPAVTVTTLPPAAGQAFRYRYRGLRLLIMGQGRMFLVPDRWSASDSALIVPLDGSVRVQFQFENQPPA